MCEIVEIRLPHSPLGFNADAWVEGKRGVWKTETGDFVQIHHMSKPFIIGVLTFIREHEASFEHSRVYNALLRELRKRKKETDGKKETD